MMFSESTAHKTVRKVKLPFVNNRKEAKQKKPPIFLAKPNLYDLCEAHFQGTVPSPLHHRQQLGMRTGNRT